MMTREHISEAYITLTNWAEYNALSNLYARLDAVKN